MYAQPPAHIDDLSDCSFYHRMEIPGVGVVGDQWELRDVADDYLGQLDFHGKRVLDVGAASGFLTFEMERRGADVVSFDMVDGRSWNLVPQAHLEDEHSDILESCARGHAEMRNGYWLAHQRLKSKAKAFYGDVYNLPKELGNFDVVVFGMILGHLRDPFQALYSGSRLCTGNVIVTNQSTTKKKKRNWFRRKRKSRRQEGSYFMPNRRNGVRQAWWALSDGCISQMLEVLGFDTINRYTSHPQCLVKTRYRREECRTTVTQRVAGRAVGQDQISVRERKVA